MIRPHLDLDGLCHENTLEDFGEVAQVEGVVRLGWCGQQTRCDGGVHADGGVYQRLIQRQDLRYLLC